MCEWVWFGSEILAHLGELEGFIVAYHMKKEGLFYHRSEDWLV